MKYYCAEPLNDLISNICKLLSTPFFNSTLSTFKKREAVQAVNSIFGSIVIVNSYAFLEVLYNIFLDFTNCVFIGYNLQIIKKLLALFLIIISIFVIQGY